MEEFTDKLANLTEEQARGLLVELDKEVCPKHFYHFVRAAWTHIPGQTQFKDNWHIAALCYHFQALIERQFSTLVVNISPNCSKSSVACVLLPLWIWIRDPSAGLWLGSFSQKLCSRDADRMRGLIRSGWFQQRWGSLIKLREEQAQLMYYHNSAGGWRLAATIGSKSGFGMHPTILGIDDPHDPREAASPTYCRIACDYWTDTLSSRGILSDVVKFQIAQRLSENDLSSHILRLNPECVHLRIPMRYEEGHPCVTNITYYDIDDQDEEGRFKQKTEWRDPREKEGELMWPDFFTEEKLREAQVVMRAHQIAGQYQQQPSSPQGDMFTADMFDNLVDSPPSEGYAIRAWDKASSTTAKSDYTVGVLMVLDGQYYYVVDVVRGRWERKERDEKISETAENDCMMYRSYEIRFEQEGGAAGKDAANMHAEELSVDYKVRISKAPGKPKRLDDDLKGWDSWHELLSRNVVRFVKGPWMKSLKHEHTSAPLGRHDDIIDACSHAARVLSASRHRGKIRRPLLLVTDKEQKELGHDKDLCNHCHGLGCGSCGFSGFIAPVSELDSIFMGLQEEPEHPLLAE